MTHADTYGLLDDMPPAARLEYFSNDLNRFTQILAETPSEEMTVLLPHLEEVTKDLESQWETYKGKRNRALLRAERRLGIGKPDENSPTTE